MAELGASQVVVADKSGKPEVLHAISRPTPQPVRDEVRIDVAAAGVAFGDIMLREGLVREAPKPLTPGYDVTGVVSALGPDAAGIAIGDRVVATTGGWGGYAAQVVVPSWRAVPFTADLPPAAATSLVLNYLTAYQML